ncbi:MAG: efflux RND transporter periplasmic adaptor subunit [Planctomycetota bacterium]|nr:efflux RND transporter periplasmic adaptor subunit [Planctomycetota bacterium]
MNIIRRLIRFILPVGILAGCLYGAKVIFDRAPEAKKRKPPSGKLTVEIVRAEAQEYRIELETRGTVRPRTQSDLIPEVAGKIVGIASEFREGGYFEEGDVLLEIETSDYEITLIKAETNLAVAESALEEGVIASKRRLPDVTVSESLLVQAKLALDETKLEAKNKEAEVAVAKAELAKATAGLATAKSLPDIRKAAVRVSLSLLAQARLVLHEEEARSLQAIEDWKKLGNGHSPSELAQRKPQLDAARASVDAADAQIEQRRIEVELAPSVLETALAEVAAAKAHLVQRELDLELNEVAVKAAESAVSSAEAQLTQKQLDLTLTKPRLATARASVTAAEADVRQKKLNLARTKITAPYAGRVLSRNVDVGQYVSPGSALATIYAVDFAEIRLPLTNQQLQFVEIPALYRGESVEQRAAGPQVTLTASLGMETFQWQGRIVRAEGAIDTRSRQSFVIAQVDNPYGKSVAGRPPLKSGMFVKATIAGRVLKDVYVLPRAAIREGKHVFVINEANELMRRDIEILWSNPNEIVVNKGLSPGERICLSPVSFAGEKVSVEVKGEKTTAQDAGEPGK